jgi:hypothetical protein
VKKYFLGAAALLAASAPGVASAMTGHVDASYSQNTLDPIDIDTAGLGGQVAFKSGGPMDFQVDGRYSHLTANGGGDANVYAAGVHFFNRTDDHLVGGYVGYESIDGSGTVNDWSAAAELQVYRAHSTLTLRGSWSEVQDIELRGWVLEGRYEYFASDNLSLNADFGAGQGQALGANIKTWNASLGGEYQFTGTPISVFGGYNYQRLTAGGGSEHSDSVGVGVRLNFGEGSLLERSHAGAGLARVQSAYERFFGGFGPQ